MFEKMFIGKQDIYGNQLHEGDKVVCKWSGTEEPYNKLEGIITYSEKYCCFYLKTKDFSPTFFSTDKLSQMYDIKNISKINS